jgi:hypothetical protein
MEVFVHKETGVIQVFPVPDGIEEWHKVEVPEGFSVSGKVFDPASKSFKPDVEALGAAVRTTRDERLAATDWVVIKSQETGLPVPPEWAAYRQALRDITKQPGFPLEVEWPVEPEVT